MAGSSTEASALIRLVEDDALFSNAKFAAPVTRQEDGRDRFEITATFVEPSGEKPKLTASTGPTHSRLVAMLIFFGLPVLLSTLAVLTFFRLATITWLPGRRNSSCRFFVRRLVPPLRGQGR